jgi:hypothetical protein
LKFYTEGTLDSNTTASEKSTATKSEDVPPKQAQPNVEQDVESTEQPEAIDIDLSDPEVQKAASAIQMRFRSHFKRGKAKENQEETQPEVVDDKEVSEQAQNELSNLDLDDPELNKAASVIQSKFRTYLSEKNKTTEHAETQKENEDVGDDTEPAISHTEDPDLTVAESTTDKIIPATEESNTDEQVPPPVPAPAEVPEETEGKEESIPKPSSPENQEKVEKEGDPKEALPSEPVADEELQPSETEGEGATSKEAEPQAEGSGESGESPGTKEETKGEEDSGGDGGGGSGDVGEGGDGGSGGASGDVGDGGEGGDGGDGGASGDGGDVGEGGDGDGHNGGEGGGDGEGGEDEPADKDPAVTTEQVEATAGDGEKQEGGAPEVCIETSVM